MNLSKEQIDYFWARIDKTGGDDACWNWLGCLTLEYGQVTYNYKNWGAHVLALTLTTGSKPLDKPFACHNCKQNPKCCNPKHLRWDTAAENARDKIKDGTLWTKLTELQVKEIREKYVPRKYSLKKLAGEYNVGVAAIHLIVHRKSWKHV